MAKRRDTPPTNPLLKNRVAAIVGPVAHSVQSEPEEGAEPVPAGKAANTPRSGEVYTQVKTRFTPEDAEEIKRFVRTLSSYLQTTVMRAEVTRALWTLALRSQDQLAELAAKAPDVDRPSNGDRLAMAQYEDAIAEFLLMALKKTPRG